MKSVLASLVVTVAISATAQVPSTGSWTKVDFAGNENVKEVYLSNNVVRMKSPSDVDVRMGIFFARFKPNMKIRPGDTQLPVTHSIRVTVYDCKNATFGIIGATYFNGEENVFTSNPNVVVMEVGEISIFKAEMKSICSVPASKLIPHEQPSSPRNPNTI